MAHLTNAWSNEILENFAMAINLLLLTSQPTVIESNHGQCITSLARSLDTYERDSPG